MAQRSRSSLPSHTGQLKQAGNHRNTLAQMCLAADGN